MNIPNKNSNQQDPRRIKRITWIGLFSNISIAAVKFTAGFFGSSQAVIADAVHSLSDTATDIAILIGVRYWTAPADECHPYGHRKIETIVAAGIGLALAGVAVAMGAHAVVGISERHASSPNIIALAGALISIVLKEGLFRWTIRVGKQERSRAVIANAWHHRSDALSSIPAAIAVIVAMIRPDWIFVDHIGAIVVSVFILHAAWRIVKPVFAELTDTSASPLVHDQIRDAAIAVHKAESVHAIRTRQMGSAIFVDLHITVDPEITVRAGHDIASAVEKNIQDQVPDIVDVVVHLEPEERKK